jgi:hypothetical protein
MTVEEARKRVLDDIKPERKQIESALREARKRLPKVQKDATAASDRWWKLARKNGLDNPITDKEKEAAHAHDQSARQLRSVESAIMTATRKLNELTDEAAIERRTQDKLRTYERISQLKTKENGSMSSAATAPRASKTTGEVPAAVSNKIVKLYVEKGLSTPPITEQLNKENAEPHKKSWTDSKVRSILTSETGKTLSQLRKKSPAASRALADRPPAATRKVSNGNGNGKTATAKPISKSAQAAGTSRGGTGSKKKPAARKKTATAKR